MKRKLKVIIPLGLAAAILIALALYIEGGYFHSLNYTKYDNNGNALWHYAIDWKGTLTVGGSVDLDGKLNMEIIENAYDKKGGVHVPAAKIVRRIVVEECVTGIAAHGFSGLSRVKEITLPESLATIRDAAFSGTAIESIRIPAGVSEIDGGAFTCCDRLTDIQVDAASPCFTFEGNTLFSKDKTVLVRYLGGADETSFSVPAGVKTLADNSFYALQYLEQVDLPGSVTKIGQSAFENCDALAEITVPAGVTTIGASAFNNCRQMKKAALPDTAEQLGDSLFINCENLSEVRLPAGMTEVPDLMFCGCRSLTSLTLPENVTEIGDRAFYACDSLEKLTIPGGVTSIGESPFTVCPLLKDIYFGGTKEQWKTLIGSEKEAGLGDAVTVHFAEG